MDPGSPLRCVRDDPRFFRSADKPYLASRQTELRLISASSSARVTGTS